MDEVDQLIEAASLKWYAYGVLFGKHKTSNEVAFATIIVSVYLDKYTPMKRKFEAPTLALALEELKKWLCDPEYVQTKTKAEPISSIEKKQKQAKLFDGL